MNRFAAALIVLFLTTLFNQAQTVALLEKTELYSVYDTALAEYDSRLVLIDSQDTIVSVYDIIENKLIKNTLKNLPESALESSVIIKTGFDLPAVHVTVSCDTKKDRTYFVHNGQILQEYPMDTDYFSSEQELFAQADKHHIRVHSVVSADEKTENYCYALKESYLQLFENNELEALKQINNLQFSSETLQKLVASLAKKSGIHHKIAVYQYIDRENQSFMALRTAITFTLGGQKTVLNGTKWTIVINPHYPKELMTALIYHEMGHIVHKDPEENNKQDISPERSREREYLADDFLYKQLLKDNRVEPYIYYYNFLSEQALSEEEYDEITAMHPRSSERASLCLAFLKEHFPPVKK